jgi:LPXTG-motif cell wall-anchored protein
MTPNRVVHMMHRLLRHGFVSVGAASVAVLGMHGVSLAGGVEFFSFTPGTIELTADEANEVSVAVDFADAFPTEPGDYDAWMVIDEYSQGSIACEPLPDGLTFAFLSPGPTWETAEGRPAYYWGGSTVVPGSTIYNYAPTGIEISGTPTETGTFTTCWGIVDNGSFDFPPVTVPNGWIPLTITVADGLPDTGSGITGLVLVGFFAGTLGAVASIVSSRRRTA